ncbi:MAG TPA: nuclear transport factor 2 family protein [Terriglobales bacterium]|nr:nuclear transport factor 2 family protein [Terriglobales bacterium]
MKNRDFTWYLVAAMAVISVVWAQGAPSGAEPTVAALEHKWLEAIKASNPDLVAPLLADKFVQTAADGKVTGKADALAEVKGEKVASAENTDMKVSVFGNTAIATYGFKAKGIDVGGKSFDVNERWTDTWIKMPNGQWQCVAAHGSSVKK